ncbi:MAG TPA: TadE/TadG family type IV pilus assembly protein [Caulobacteraceae bacterium]|jgi:Flp pilus assembly protein TadG|nr:TadE/TadG family type IV pilus assembly protein [Caulobacteraceae bacterium]
MLKYRAKSFLKDVHGGSLAEFAMVVPAFFALVFAVIHLSFVTWGMTAMHWACETAARCASINVPLGASGATCTDNNSTKAYAATEYKGPNMSVVFTSDIANSCGKKVSATASYAMNVVVTKITLNLSAQACNH